MPKATWSRWLRALFKTLRVEGSMIFTTHGPASARKFLVDASLDDEGFYFKPDSEQHDLEGSEYGTTVTSNRFVVEQLETLENCELRLVRPGYWWGHQDLYLVSRIASASVLLPDLNIYQPDDRVAGHVERISIVDKPSALRTQRILRVTGWLTPDVKGESPADSIILLLRDENGLQLSCEAGRQDRNDVAGVLGNPALVKTGFNSVVEIPHTKGKLTLHLAVRCGNELQLCTTVSLPLER